MSISFRHLFAVMLGSCASDEPMTKPELLLALQTEIRRHFFDTFVENPPSLAQGGKGVVVPGCPACQRRIHTMVKFVDHLADDVLPRLVEGLPLD